jgi:hypothetical protein
MAMSIRTPATTRVYDFPAYRPRGRQAVAAWDHAGIFFCEEGVDMEYEARTCGDHRYIIVEKNTYPIRRECKENLGVGELRIGVLAAKGCPLDMSCICLDGGCCSICKHMVLAPPKEEKEKTDRLQLICRYGEEKPTPDAILLQVEGCPLDRENCLMCEERFAPCTPFRSYPRKSHAYVVCSASKNEARPQGEDQEK